MKLPTTADVTDLTDTRSRRMAYVTDNGEALMKALGCPPRTRHITIDIPTDDIVTITYVQIADPEQLAALGRAYDDIKPDTVD